MAHTGAAAVEAIVAPSSVVHGPIRESEHPDTAERNTVAVTHWNAVPPFGRLDLVVIASSWSNRSWPGNFFKQTDPVNPFHPSQLTTRYSPLVIAGTCGTGDEFRTEVPYAGSPVAHKMLAADGERGAIGWIGPTAGTWQHGNAHVLRAMVEELYAAPGRPMAESFRVAVRRVAVEHSTRPDVLTTARSYVMFGDPLSPWRPVFAYAVGVDPAGPPQLATLHPNQPNPFRDATRIALTLPGPGRVTLRIYDVGGRLVRTLIDGHLPAGGHSFHWDGDNRRGQPAASGIYFCRLATPGRELTRKMVRVE